MGAISISDKKFEKEIIDSIKQLGSKHSVYQVFQDWIKLSAITLSNMVDWFHKDEREEQYLQAIRKYTREELNQLANMFGMLRLVVMELLESGSLYDVLGYIFEKLELNDVDSGQVFTPNHVCELMGDLAIDDECKREIEKNGYISVYEPASGSGAMIIGVAKAMLKHNLDYQQQMLVVAEDIDITCVYMTYLQISLYKIPAIVIHGDSLGDEVWSKWYTPTYMVDMWPLRNRKNIADILGSKEQKPDVRILPNIEQVSEYAELTVEENGQISLL